MNDKIKKIIVWGIVIIVLINALLGIGFLRGRDPGIPNGNESELRTELERIKEQHNREVDDYQRRLGELEERLQTARGDLQELGRLNESSGRIIRSIGETVSDVGTTSANANELFKQLRSNQQAIRLYVEELRDRNSEMQQYYNRIQNSLGEQ